MLLRHPKNTASLACLLIILFSVLGSGGLLASDDEASTVTIFFTGLVDGNYGPCGCTTTPSGGFSRRAAYARQYAEEGESHILHVDLGGMFLPLGPHAEAVNQQFLKAVETLPLSVLNLGSANLFMWDQIASSQLSEHFISTNLTPFDSSRSTPERYRIVTIPETTGKSGPLSIGFVGLTSPRSVKPNSGFRGDDPLQALQAIKAEVMEEADFLVVLTDIEQRPGEEFHANLARAHPEVSVILAAESVYALHEPEMVNHAIILSSVERGRHLGQLKLTIDGKGKVQEVEPEFIQLDDTRPEDPHFLSIQNTLQRLLPG